MDQYRRSSALGGPTPPCTPQVGDYFNYSVFDHQMMLKGLAFVGIDEATAKKNKFMVRRRQGGVRGWG